MFSTPYHFRQQRRVIIAHSHGGHLRVSPNAHRQLDCNGGKGQLARWRVELLGGNSVQIRSVKTQRYLRICKRGNVMDVDGGGGPFCKFRIHRQGSGVKLESERFPGRYVAVTPQRHPKIGGGGKHCLLYFYHNGGGGGGGANVVVVEQPRPVVQVVQPTAPPVQQYQPQVQVIQQPQPQVTVITTETNVAGGRHGFGAPYGFRNNREVVVRGPHGRSLRVEGRNASGSGSFGQAARWRVHVLGGNRIKLQSCKTGRYLRVTKHRVLDADGGGGKHTEFRCQIVRGPNVVKLHSVHHSGCYVALMANGNARVGGGGHNCVLTFLKQGAQQQETIVIQKQQPAQVVYQQPPPQVVYQQPPPQQYQQPPPQQYQQPPPQQYQQPPPQQYQQPPPQQYQQPPPQQYQQPPPQQYQQPPPQQYQQPPPQQYQPQPNAPPQGEPGNQYSGGY